MACSSACCSEGPQTWCPISCGKTCSSTKRRQIDTLRTEHGSLPLLFPAYQVSVSRRNPTPDGNRSHPCRRDRLHVSVQKEHQVQRTGLQLVAAIVAVIGTPGDDRVLCWLPGVKLASTSAFPGPLQSPVGHVLD